MKVTKSAMDLWRDRKKKARVDVVVRMVMGETFSPFFEREEVLSLCGEKIIETSEFQVGYSYWFTLL